MRISQELNNRLDSFTRNRHASVIVGIVVLAAVIFALVIGSLFGNVVGFIVAFVAGAVAMSKASAPTVAAVAEATTVTPRTRKLRRPSEKATTRPKRANARKSS